MFVPKTHARLRIGRRAVYIVTRLLPPGNGCREHSSREHGPTRSLNNFVARSARLSYRRRISLSVWPSARLSHVGIYSKPKNVGSCGLHHRLARGVQCFETTFTSLDPSGFCQISRKWCNIQQYLQRQHHRKS